MDPLCDAYAKTMREKWEEVRKLQAHRQQTNDEDLRMAYSKVIKDLLWLIQKETYDFIHTMIEYEFHFFTENEERAFLQQMLNRFPSQ